jgi:hypothetical protein
MSGASSHSRGEHPISDEAISLLRRRMIEDMTIRAIASKTQ